MLSEIQQKKLSHLFDILDDNKNGFLQMDDFVNIGRKILEQTDYPENSRRGRLILLRASRLFVQLLVDMENDDMTISFHDWMNIFKNHLESDDSSLVKNYIHRTTYHLFSLFDVNGDNFISEEEYSLMLSTYNIPTNKSKDSFGELDVNGDGYISVEELIDGFENYFTSSEPDAPGNLIFGDWR